MPPQPFLFVAQLGSSDASTIAHFTTNVKQIELWISIDCIWTGDEYIDITFDFATLCKNWGH